MAGDWKRDIDIRQPSPARMYDYYLGGSHNYAADREAAEDVIAVMPNVREIARANRGFLHRVVKHLVGEGIDQFLDIGSGIPTVGNVHEIAQQANPDTRVVYVDTDPVAVAHSLQILKGNDNATAIRVDLRDPDAIVSHTGLQNVLDLARPVALILASVLHFIAEDEAYPAARSLREALVTGSYLAISHAAAEGITPERSTAAAEVYRRSTVPTSARRNRAEILKFFDGYHLIEPGLVWVSQWRPDTATKPEEHPEHIAYLGGVGLKRT